MIDKIVASAREAVAPVESGMTVLIGGFGQVGTPNHLIEALCEKGVRDLVVVSNNAGTGTHGLARLMAEGRVRKVICSYPRSRGSVVLEELYREGRIELEIVPQGTLAERLRAAGAGIPAFYTPTAAGTLLAEGKETRTFGGRACVLEHALPGDVALIEAWEADRWGNLTFRKSGRNFNPVMAMAARCTIVQAHHIVSLGELDPERIVTPGVFVDRVVHIPYGSPRLT
ncbi:MAG: 3-oxoacid CoA-transferase subunit A [Elioraea sp.]|nr:3-oxoacid CoA-transferase subunit A [Elioraea sp.]